MTKCRLECEFINDKINYILCIKHDAWCKTRTHLTDSSLCRLDDLTASQIRLYTEMTIQDITEQGVIHLHITSQPGIKSGATLPIENTQFQIYQSEQMTYDPIFSIHRVKASVKPWSWVVGWTPIYLWYLVVKKVALDQSTYYRNNTKNNIKTKLRTFQMNYKHYCAMAQPPVYE